MTKPTLILQNSVFRIKLVRWLAPIIMTILIIGLIKNWIKHDFTFDLDFFVFNLTSILLLIYMPYLARTFIRERLTLDHTGIHYCSGKSLWKATSNDDWHFHWENIQTISVVQTNSSYYAQLRFIVRQCEKQDYETPIFKWVDSHTLDTAHTKSIYKYKVFGFEFTGRDTITAEEFNESVLRTPIYQYLAQYQDQPIRIVPEEDQHIDGYTNYFLFFFVFLIILLIFFPSILVYLVS